MKIKMSQLVALTGVPKSTILYYIKEGLLPQPERIKQNVCLYDESFVEKIKFIKFLQSSYGRSICEIKESVCGGEYDFSKGSQPLIGFLEKLSGTAANSERFGEEELLKRSGVERAFFDEICKAGLMVPLSEGSFDERDVQMLELYYKLSKKGWSLDFFKKYKELSGELASFMIGEIVKAKDNAKEKGEMDNELQHLMFEIPLAIEPYLINRLGIREYRRLTIQKGM